MNAKYWPCFEVKGGGDCTGADMSAKLASPVSLIRSIPSTCCYGAFSARSVDRLELALGPSSRGPDPCRRDQRAVKSHAGEPTQRAGSALVIWGPRDTPGDLNVSQRGKGTARSLQGMFWADNMPYI